MKSRRIWALFFVGLLIRIADAAAPAGLQTEHATDPLGIGVTVPRLSWLLPSTAPGEMQTAYELQAATSLDKLSTAPDLVHSGKVSSTQSNLVPWPTAPLASRAEVYWRVRLWDQDNHETEWSAPAHFELGLLEGDSSWRAQWITDTVPRDGPLPTAVTTASWIWAQPGDAEAKQAYFHKTITLPPGAHVRDAQCDISGQGGFTLFVNGKMARQAANRPNAGKKLTHGYLRDLVKEGKNNFALVAPAASDHPGVVGVITIELDDDTHLTIPTDGTWKATMQSVPTTWNRPGDFDDSSWSAATVLAKFSEPPYAAIAGEATTGPGRYFRKMFSLHGPIAKARLRATALGLYEVHINGHPVTTDQFTPGWTEYTRRVMVQTYDVTSLLNPGENTCAALLTDGWYAGRVGWMGLSQYGTTPAFAAQLELTYQDGQTETVPTDESWKSGTGPVQGADLQWGESVDARIADPLAATFDESGWSPAVAVQPKVGTLVPQVGPPVRTLMTVPPKSITQRGDATVIDFGQNLVGHVWLSAQGPAGATITLRHAETITSTGAVYTANLRPARATDTFTLAGKGGAEVFDPAMTFHGFRYVEISGYPGTLAAENVYAVVVGSDTPATGSFECSDPRVNRLYQNILWSQRGNFLSVPTDCPQRDERMGWMGDAQVFARTAADNADVSGFFTKWLRDVDDAQTPQGAFPNFAPRAGQPQPGVPGWADAGVIIPWTVYEAYGDTRILEDHYPAMAKFVEFLRADTQNNLRPNRGIGDHLNPGTVTPLDLVSTAFYAHSVDLTAKAAAILHKTDDAQKYAQLFQDIAAAYTRAYVADDGTVKGNTQSSYLFSLAFHLVLDEMRPKLAQHLAADVESHGHLTTGFLGVSLLCPTLTDVGRSDLAYKLLLTDTFPSWLFPLKYDATTIWERWDGYTPDKGFQDPSMNSFNHYSLGSVGQWFYSGIAGIGPDDSSPETAGYHHFFLRPQVSRTLAADAGHPSFAHTSYKTPYGVIVSNWDIRGNEAAFHLTIPPNTTATFDALGDHRDLAPGEHDFSLPCP